MEPQQLASVWGWRGAASGVVQCMKQIYESGERSDVQFAVGRQYGEEQLFRAHKFVLGLRSDVFDAMVNGEVPQTTDEMIELPDILPQAFGVMLKYLYTDEVEDLQLDNVLPTMYCAKKYGLPKLIDISVEYAIKNVEKETCLTVLEAAKVLESEKLVNYCLQIVDVHGRELLQTQEFLQLNNETLRMILIRDTLMVSDQEVYKAAERWAMNACRSSELESTAANYRRMLGEALFLIRFPLINDEQLANGPVASGLLLNEEVLKINQFKYAAKKPDIRFSGIPRSSNIPFRERRWFILGDSDGNGVTAGNALFDIHQRLHLRVSLHNGIWKGAAACSTYPFGFGRYEFHIEGLDQLDPKVTLAIYSGDLSERACMKFVKVGEENTRNGLNFSVRHPNCMAPFSDDTAHYNEITRLYPRTTHSYHRRRDGVSFSSQRGHQQNNTLGELSNWSYDFKPSIPEKAVPVFFFLVPRDKLPSDGRELEIIVHSFRFYPDG